MALHQKNDEVGFEKGSYMSNITGMGVRAGIIGALDISRGDMFIIG